MGKLFNSRDMENMENKNINKKEAVVYNIREARLLGKKDSEIEPQKMDENIFRFMPSIFKINQQNQVMIYNTNARI